MRSTRVKLNNKRIKSKFKESKAKPLRRRLRRNDSSSWNNKRMKNRKLKLKRMAPKPFSKPKVAPLVPISSQRLLRNL